mgnify:CR=1 FL=1
MTRRLFAVTFSLTLLATVGLSVPAHAAPNCSNTTPALDEEVTCTYSAGGFTDITVPAGADYMAIVLKGAGGGGGGGSIFSGGTGASGGSGAQVAATLQVSSVSNIRLVLGAGGAGGTATPTVGQGGVGGGYSALYEGTSTNASDVLAVAGGGGGGAGEEVVASTKTGGSGSASNTAAGGDGVGPGYGAPGDGTGGTGSDGSDGGSWASGGAGGTGFGLSSGNGGAGYGGGEEGGASGGIDGGGGAGGSYVRPSLLSGIATYSPNGGSGGSGLANRSGTSGGNGSVVITFSADPIAPTVSSAPVAQFAEFSYFLPDGRECTSISPQRVQVGTYVELPGVDANCHSMPGSEVAGWMIPVAPGFTGAGSSSLPLNPGHRVRVIESQRFTAVTLDPVLTIEYDSNIANGDACTPANLAHASDNGRVGYSWVPRVDFAMARAWGQAPCTPEGHELVGWNTAGNGSGESIELGAPFPADWETSRVNDHRLFAEWSPRL